MKKLSLIFTLAFAMICSFKAKAQTNTDYYIGKWQVTVIGTPQGDSKMTFLFKKEDGKLTGALADSTGKEVTKLTTLEVKEKTLTAGFNMQNYDISLTLDPVDEDHVQGGLMGGMFVAKGVRIKEKQ